MVASTRLALARSHAQENGADVTRLGVETSNSGQAVSPFRGRLLVAVPLTIGVTAWWQLVAGPPSAGHAGGSGLAHPGVTALLTFPLALLAAIGSDWALHRRYRVSWSAGAGERGGPVGRPMFLRAAVTAGIFVVLFFMTAPLRQAAHDALLATPRPDLAAIGYEVSCPPSASAQECRRIEEGLASFDAAMLASLHGAMVDHGQHSASAGASATGQHTVHGHGAASDRDAWQTLAVFGIALLLAVSGLVLARIRPASARVLPASVRVLPASGAAGARGRWHWGAAGAALVLLLGGSLVFAPGAQASAVPPPFSVPLRIPPVLTGAQIDLTMAQTEVQLLPSGPPTRMWTYNGMFPGPTIRRPSGQATQVTVHNQLPAAAGSMTLHHHGSHSRSAEDGQPAADLIPPGGQRTYRYEHQEQGRPERAATQWYHDHRMDVTGRNVWNGLAGMVILDDEVDSALPLPRGEFDVPLMIVDRTFDADNQIPYRFNSIGTVADTVLVNGVPQPYFEVGDRRYRLRVLNASNRRSYTLALSNGQAMTQIGTESGLLPAPVTRTQIEVFPAERVELVIDFAGRLGQDIVLRNLAGDGPGTAQVMQFRVTRDVAETSFVPPALRPAPTFPQPVRTRTFSLNFDASTGSWTINNQSFDPDRVDADPVLGTTERWVFVNQSFATHVIHIHDVDWRLESRNLQPPQPWEDGLKEVWRIDPLERISLITTFTDNAGRYVFHCHILEHEDHAMMAQFEVRP
jgi:spore coat protein A, manganese oxidase